VYAKPPDHFASIVDLPPYIAQYLWNRIAHNTRKSYTSDIHQYYRSCKLAGYCHENGFPFPAKPLWLMNFIVELAGKIQPVGIKKKLTSLRSYHVDCGFPLDVFKDNQLERVLRGIKWTTFPALGKLPDRTPLTRDLLHSLLQHVDTKTHSGATICTVFTLAFAAFLQLGEFTYSMSDLSSSEYSFQ
jgi:hypothetical protein